MCVGKYKNITTNKRKQTQQKPNLIALRRLACVEMGTGEKVGRGEERRGDERREEMRRGEKIGRGLREE